MPPENATGQYLELPLDRIRASSQNPRSATNEAGIAELAQSILRYGLIQPIVVRETPIGGRTWEIIAGHRRCEAARRAGLERIRAVLLRETPDRLALELMLAENVQREGLDPIDEARAYQRLMDECRLTQAQLAARVGRSQPHVSGMLALLELPVDVQFQVKRREIPVSHGKRLAVLADRPDECRRLAAKAARTSFPELSREVTQVRSGSVACPPPKRPPGACRVRGSAGGPH